MAAWPASPALVCTGLGRCAHTRHCGSMPGDDDAPNPTPAAAQGAAHAPKPAKRRNIRKRKALADGDGSDGEPGSEEGPSLR